MTHLHSSLDAPQPAATFDPPRRWGIPSALMEPAPIGQLGMFVSERPGLRLSRPMVVGWLMTNRCNLRCRHCWVDHRRDGCGRKARAQIAHRLAHAGLCRVVLSGGEVTLLPDLRQCLELLKTTHTPVSVYTNATALRRLDWLEHWDPEIDYVQVSIDGGSAATFEAQRGAGTFAKFMAGLGRLRAKGVRVLAHYVATPWNSRAGDLREAARLAARFGCEAFVAEIFHPRGRAADLGRAVAAEVAARLLKEARGLVEVPEPDLETMPIHLALPPLLPFPEWYTATVVSARPEAVSAGLRSGVPFGTTHCFVMANGDVVPSTEVADDPACIYGSLLKEELEPLWAKGQERSGLPWLRDLNGTACDGCPDFPWCRGGSVKRVLERHGGFDAPDPWCYRLPPTPAPVRSTA